jgi:hypothetical protein
MNDSGAVEQGRVQRLDEAMAEYLIDADAGRAPKREAFLARYPDLQDDLAAFLDDQANLERLVEPLRGQPGPPESTQAESLYTGRPVSDRERATDARDDRGRSRAWRRGPAR